MCSPVGIALRFFHTPGASPRKHARPPKKKHGPGIKLALTDFVGIEDAPQSLPETGFNQAQTFRSH